MLASIVCRSLLRSIFAVGVVVAAVAGSVLAREARDTADRWPAFRHEQLPRQLQCLATASTARLVTTLHVRGCHRYAEDVLTIEYNGDHGRHTLSRHTDNVVATTTTTTTTTQARAMALTVASAVGLPTAEPSAHGSRLQRWAEVAVTCDGETTRVSLPMSTETHTDDAFDVIAWAADSDVPLDRARVVTAASKFLRAFGGGLVIVDEDDPLAMVLATHPVASTPVDAVDAIFRFREQGQ